MSSSAKLQDFFEKLVESSTETAPSRGSFMKKERLSKGFTFLLHTSVGASVLDAQRCGSSRSKRSTHVFKCKAPGLFQKLVESSTEAAPSSRSSMEKVPLSKGLGNFYWIPSQLDTLKRKLRVFFRVIFLKLEAPHVCFGKCSFYGVFSKKRIALS